MSIPYTSGDFTSARANGESWVEYPFIEQGDNATKVYHLVCEVNEADYAPIALDTTMASASNADVISLPFTANAAAYHVGDFGKAKIDGGLTRFDRVFRTIPSTRNNVFGGTTAFSYPGRASNKEGGTDRTVTAASNTAGVTTLTCTNSVSVGEAFYYTVTTTQDGITVNSSGYAYALSGTSGGVIKMPAIALGTTFVSGTVTELVIQPSGQKTISTGTLVDYTYYLPGVTPGITNPEDVTESAVFSPFSAETGEAVNTLTNKTIPDQATYNTQVSSGDYLIIESNVTRLQGNIIQKADVKVRAL